MGKKLHYLGKKIEKKRKENDNFGHFSQIEANSLFGSGAVFFPVCPKKLIYSANPAGVLTSELS